MKFDHKVVLCNNEDVHSLAAELENEWAFSLLYRFKVDPAIIKKCKEDSHYTKKDWRNFIFDNYGIRIGKDLSTGTLSIKRLNFKTYEDLELGRWDKPEVIRVKNANDNYCELHLKYWQIV